MRQRRRRRRRVAFIIHTRRRNYMCLYNIAYKTVRVEKNENPNSDNIIL